ncbi:MAG: methyl-accepting chemotaxis protein [Spirochaetota bacterium]
MARSILAGFRHISSKFQLIFGGLILLALIALGAVVFVNLSRELSAWGLRQLGVSTELIVKTTEHQIDESVRQGLVKHAKDARDVAELLYQEVRAGLVREETAKSLFRQYVLQSGMSRIGETGYLAVIDSKGVAVIHPTSQGKDFSSYEFMQRALKLRDGFLTYKLKGPTDTEEREKVGGMAYFEPWDMIIWASSYESEFATLFDIPSLSDLLSAISKEQGIEITVVTKAGKPILNPYQDKPSMLDLVDAKGVAWVRKILETPEGGITFDPLDANGKALGWRTARFMSLDLMKWTIVVAVPSRTISEMAYTSLLIIVVASLILFALLLLLINRVTASLTKPLETTGALLAKALAGDLAQRISVEGADEVGQMGLHFNELLEMLDNLLHQVQSNATEMTAMVQGLSASTQEISATANEQAAAVKEIVSTIEDTDLLSKNISTRVEEVSRIAGDTKSNVEDGFAAVRDNIGKMGEIHEANGKTISGINFLSDKIKNIWDIVNIINGIADQTKIIAFNAELEASSAGEAGKNFQIVASEIRRLADSTVTSTNEIKIRIQEIERSSDALLLSSEQGTERIIQGKDLSQRMNKLFGDIAMSAEVSSSSTSQIAVSIRQQVGSFEQILIAIKMISQGVDNFVVATRATSATTESLRKMAAQLSALIGKFEKPQE